MMKKALLMAAILSLGWVIFILVNTRSGVSVILTGFEGEAAPFSKVLEQQLNVSEKIGMCQSGFEGYLYGNKVLVATSGMAKVKTTACLTDILHTYGKRIKEVLVVGIAGITPTRLGSEAVMIGDVCINSLALDFDLQHYSSDQAGSSLSSPIFWPQESEFAAKSTKGSPALARELEAASSQVVWQTATQSVKDINILYHGTSRDPKVWGQNDCMEVTSDLYWHDVKADEIAREEAAKYLGEVKGETVSSADILVVTSMEAVPAGVVVDWWNKDESTNIAFAYVRGASNFDHVNLNSDGIPAEGGQESLRKFQVGDLSQFAIDTAALPVLKMFELRSTQ